MKRFVWALLLLTAPAMAAAPKADEVGAYRTLATQDARLATVGYRLAYANAPYCKNAGFNPGWVLHDIAQYPDADVARDAFGFTHPIQISAIVQGGPAEAEGFRAGDALLRAGQTDVSTLAGKGYQRIETLKRLLDADWGPKYLVSLALEREGARFEKLFRLDPICASEFWVDSRNKVDAGADGEKVRITSGMMAFAADDNELAAVVAHELAHNLLGHRERLAAIKRGKTKAILETEIEADRLSVWLMINAGFDPTAALRFNERYGRKFGLGIFSDGTHHRWKKRVDVIAAEIALINSVQPKDGLRDPPLLQAYRNSQ